MIACVVNSPLLQLFLNYYYCTIACVANRPLLLLFTITVRLHV